MPDYWFMEKTQDIDPIELEECDLPDIAIDMDVFDSEEEYYSELHDYLISLSRDIIDRKHRETHRDLIHATRTYDELEKIIEREISDIDEKK